MHALRFLLDLAGCEALRDEMIHCLNLFFCEAGLLLLLGRHFVQQLVVPVGLDVVSNSLHRLGYHFFLFPFLLLFLMLPMLLCPHDLLMKRFTSCVLLGLEVRIRCRLLMHALRFLLDLAGCEALRDEMIHCLNLFFCEAGLLAIHGQKLLGFWELAVSFQELVVLLLDDNVLLLLHHAFELLVRCLILGLLICIRCLLLMHSLGLCLDLGGCDALRDEMLHCLNLLGCEAGLLAFRC